MLLKLNTCSLVDVNQSEIMDLYAGDITRIFESVSSRNAKGSEMTGWIPWIHRDHTPLISSIERLRDTWLGLGVEDVIIVGTGGSYIGCRAALDFINGFFQRRNFNFIFAPSFSERYTCELLSYLGGRKFAVVVISKSGSTLESAVTFRLLRDLLHGREGFDYTQYICAITDKSKGTLRKLVDRREIVNFTIEDDIGGRYSALTSVGLVPMVLSGIDVRRVLAGARRAHGENYNGDIRSNTAATYAACRYHLFMQKGLSSECLISYDPQLSFCLEKMKQLFAESEGKNGKGLMPILLNFTPDLHSVGQLLQEGNRSFFETIVLVKNSLESIVINRSKFDDDDSLDWLKGKTLGEINECAFRGTLDAHRDDAGINNLIIELESWEPETFGYFYFWLCLVAMFSSYLFGVNPFDQPGVEAYKGRMFNLLGRGS